MARSHIWIAIIGLIWWSVSLGYSNRHQETLKVSDKIVKTYSKSSKYLVFTDKGVYENSDAFFIGKFNSSDVYGGIQVGKTYECDVMGARVQFFSAYPNIVSCSEAR